MANATWESGTIGLRGCAHSGRVLSGRTSREVIGEVSSSGGGGVRSEVQGRPAAWSYGGRRDWGMSRRSAELGGGAWGGGGAIRYAMS